MHKRVFLYDDLLMRPGLRPKAAVFSIVVVDELLRICIAPQIEKELPGYICGFLLMMR
jgi:hypothetical protein